MRRHHLLRVTSTRQLCVFCACRLGAEPTLYRSVSLPPVTAADRRRHIATSQQRKSDIAAASDQKDRGTSNEQSSWAGFDSGSSLSQAEQAEKANRLRQQREQQDEERRTLRERLAPGQEHGSKVSQTVRTPHRSQRYRGIRRLDLGQLQAGEATNTKIAEEQKGYVHQDGSINGVFRRLNATGSTTDLSTATGPDQQQYTIPRVRSGGSPKDSNRSRDINKQGHGTIRFMPTYNSANRQSRGDTQQYPGLSPSGEMKAHTNIPSNPLSESEKIAVPDFKSASKAQMAGSGAVKTGWGSGSTKTRPLEHDNGKETVKFQEPGNGSTAGTANINPRMRGTTLPETLNRQMIGDKVLTNPEEDFRSAETPLSEARTTEATIDNTPHDSDTAYLAHSGQNSQGPQLQTAPVVNDRHGEPFSGGSSSSDGQGLGKTGERHSITNKPGFGLGNIDEYETISFGNEALPTHVNAFNEDYAENWQHLRRQPVEHSQPYPVVDMHSPSSQSSDQYLDDSWVDRSFEEHCRKRTTLPHPETANLPIERQPVSRFSISNSQNARKRCARCGEMGHIARQCTERSRVTCYSCGKPGHLANECPNATVTDGKTRKPRPYLTDPYAEEPSAPLVKGTDNRERDIAANASAVRPRSTESSTASGKGKWTRHHNTGDNPAEKQPVLGRRSQWAQASEITVGNEQIPGDRQSRRNQWADNGDEAEQFRKGGDRRGQRRNLRRGEDDDDGLYARDEARARKRTRLAKKDAERKAAKVEREARKAEQVTPITLPEFISVQNLSQTLGVRYEQFVDRLEELGYDDVFPSKILNTETSGMIAMEYNFEPVFDVDAVEEEERDLKARPELEDKESLPVRPSVVTIMGHVDHGKTTILDYLRKSSIAAGEAGGITQHIGAFSVPLSSSGKTITFLDTPGHAAFLAMRQRGANVTDMVILVVAADDSVKPQTLEAIKHAKAAKVPIIVAINKIDKEDADVQRCKQDLARHGVEIEDFGGDTQVVEVSGKTGKGMDDLEETVVTLSEILDHRAETDGDVEGWILEATTKKAGRVATVLVRRGTLRPGTVIVAGRTWARVKTLRNEGGQLLDQVGPGMPIEVDGWKDQPTAGDEVLQATSERKATSVVEYRHELAERSRTAQDMEAINEARRLEQEKREKEKVPDVTAQSGEKEESTSAADTGGQLPATGQMEVPFIIKADVSGSVEAVSAYILGVSNPLITPKILHCSVGAINESDIELASVAHGYIIAFNLRADPDMIGIAEAKGVKVLENNIIYRVLDNVKAVLEEKLPPVITQKVLGEAEVAASFEIGIGGRKKVSIAGCKVRNGVITKGSRVRVMRKGGKVYDGTVESLKSVKKDVQEMRKGSECGIGFDAFEGFEVGDQIQTYEEISEKRRL